MSEQQKKSIFQFVKKNHYDLKENVQQDDFADLLFEVYKSVDANDSVRVKVKSIKNELEDGDNIKPTDFISKNVDSYLERLVNFVEKQGRRENKERSRSKEIKNDKEDPLEINNIKSSGSSSSDNEDRNGRKQHRLQIIKKNRRDSKDYKNQKSRDESKRNTGDNNRSRNNNLNKSQKNLKLISQFTNQLPNLLRMGMQGSNSAFDFDQMMKAIRPNQNNRKDTVFLINLPKDYRTLSEIEQIFTGKGEISNVNLGGKVASVQFKKIQDAQQLINTDQFIVHKGLKLEFSGTPNIHKKQYQRRQQSDNQNDEEIYKQRKIDDPKQTETNQESQLQVQRQAQNNEQQQQQLQQQLQQQQQLEQQNELLRKKGELAKIERENTKTCEITKSNITSLLAEKQRTLLCLSKRTYPENLQQEIEEYKNNLKQKREQFKNITELPQLKLCFQELEEMLDHSFIVKEISDELIQGKGVLKALSDHFSAFGKIDTLQPKLKEKRALIKFLSFESAEKAYLENTVYELELNHPDIVKFFQSA